jgi:hypothetical protein
MKAKAYDARFNPSILWQPAFNPLRSNPRFKGLLAAPYRSSGLMRRR